MSSYLNNFLFFPLPYFDKASNRSSLEAISLFNETQKALQNEISDLKSALKRKEEEHESIVSDSNYILEELQSAEQQLIILRHNSAQSQQSQKSAVETLIEAQKLAVEDLKHTLQEKEQALRDKEIESILFRKAFDESPSMEVLKSLASILTNFEQAADRWHEDIFNDAMRKIDCLVVCGADMALAEKLKSLYSLVNSVALKYRDSHQISGTGCAIFKTTSDFSERKSKKTSIKTAQSGLNELPLDTLSPLSSPSVAEISLKSRSDFYHQTTKNGPIATDNISSATFSPDRKSIHASVAHRLKNHEEGSLKVDVDIGDFDETNMVDYGIATVSKELILAKMELAVSAAENDELHYEYRKLEKIMCDMKLELAEAKSTIDNMRQSPMSRHPVVSPKSP